MIIKYVNDEILPFLRVEVVLGMCVFFIAVFGAIFQHVASVFLAIIFLFSVVLMRDYKSAWASISFFQKIMFLFLILFFISGLLSYLNVVDTYEFKKQIGRYLRFALIVPVFIFVLSRRYNLLNYLLAGIILSAPVFLAYAMINMSNSPNMAPTGQYYKIMFGDVAMLHAMFIMLLLIYLDVTRIKKTLLAVSMGCTLYVSFLTEARGAWIILPVCIVPMIYYFLRFEKKKHGPGILLLVLLTIIFSVALNRDTVIERYDSAVSEIANYYSGENPYTSSDVRLLIWDSAIDVWSDVPLIGTGLGDFDEDFKKLKNIRKLKDRGLYKARQIHGNTHNMYIQSLVSTGVIGLICIVLALVILPFYFFIGLSQKSDGLVKLVGIVLVLSFAIFGLTESWTLRAPFLSIYLSYFVAIMSGVSTEQTISGMPSR